MSASIFLSKQKRRTVFALIALFALVAWVQPALSQTATDTMVSSKRSLDLIAFSSDDLRARYYLLIDQLRCPKCQNQNLSASDAQIAQALRKEVLIQLEQGQSDEQILRFMQQRYGDFVLYKPPFSGKTRVLWLFPACLFLLCLFAVVKVLRSASNVQQATSSLQTDDDQARKNTPRRHEQ